MKGSITVEATFVCPFLCVVLCAMIWVTFSLYGEVEAFGTSAVEELRKLAWNSKTVRMERLLCEWMEE